VTVHPSVGVEPDWGALCLRDLHSFGYVGLSSSDMSVYII
jgi:hypothetical protein